MDFINQLTIFLAEHPILLFGIGALLIAVLVLKGLGTRYNVDPEWSQIQEQRRTEEEIQELIEIEKNKP